MTRRISELQCRRIYLRKAGLLNRRVLRRFDCPRLRSMCERRLCATIRADSVCDTFMLAEATYAPKTIPSCP